MRFFKVIVVISKADDAIRINFWVHFRQKMSLMKDAKRDLIQTQKMMSEMQEALMANHRMMLLQQQQMITSQNASAMGPSQKRKSASESTSTDEKWVPTIGERVVKVRNERKGVQGTICRVYRDSTSGINKISVQPDTGKVFNKQSVSNFRAVD